MKTAIIIGATGLVGNQLLHLLLHDDRFSKLLVFVRRSTGIQHEKIEEHIINFDRPAEWMHLVKGDVLFSALGTTLKQAGSKDKQYTIDYTYQYQFAQAAAQNQVPTYVLISAASSSPDSKIFYSRMKGELERDVKALPFKHITIIQPGLLHGDRQEERFGEQLAYKVLNVVNAIGLFKQYRPISGKTVAMAMHNAALQSKPGVHTHTLAQVFDLAK
ncbi:oxidoreductase [Pedobacter quisquiliarum]|uniref:Oxidoreductase n=1 Tax=Pedobacter quisquiliarum TaxID=1834438 RepID=A0A916TZA0_9SPHI|nr:NAD(P)H-binding protein [Pedobacter quisquiliarum]GGC53930.1 oxidoreductase [Pedobacter quisquiliarum]